MPELDKSTIERLEQQIQLGISSIEGVNESLPEKLRSKGLSEDAVEYVLRLTQAAFNYGRILGKEEMFVLLQKIRTQRAST